MAKVPKVKRSPRVPKGCTWTPKPFTPSGIDQMDGLTHYSASGRKLKTYAAIIWYQNAYGGTFTLEDSVV